MVYAILREQLGNQLFIWAAGFSLARRWNVPLRLITSNYGRTGTYMSLRSFPIKAEFLSPWPGLISKMLLKREFYTLQSFANRVGDWEEAVEGDFAQCAFHRLKQASANKTLLDGMFQSWRYFFEDAESIRGELGVTSNLMSRYCDKDTLKRIRSGCSVSLHVRRTDYLNGGVNGKFSVCSKNYFLRCMDYCRQNLQEPVFFVFSDDIAWAKSELSAADVRFISSENYRFRNIEDFVLMSNCRHHIIPNSTYSWWAAFAGEQSGLVLGPTKWFNDDSAVIADKLLLGWKQVAV